MKSIVIRLETSQRRGIDNGQDSKISCFERNWAKDWMKMFPRIKKRTEPSPVYNCHGMTFASRRTKICKSSSINDILQDDKYEEIASNDVLPGDIVIYYSDLGDPNHSGLVVENGGLMPLICSKWGNGGEFLHYLSDCPRLYGPIHKFYRCRL